MTNLQARLAAIAPERLKGIRRGIEKESLRATAEGALAVTPHPQALGSALTHPHITTDYSEAQLELITGAWGNKNRTAPTGDRSSSCAIGTKSLPSAPRPCRTMIEATG